jgi:hypothetical protein
LAITASGQPASWLIGQGAQYGVKCHSHTGCREDKSCHGFRSSSRRSKQCG